MTFGLNFTSIGKGAFEVVLHWNILNLVMPRQQHGLFISIPESVSVYYPAAGMVGKLLTVSGMAATAVEVEAAPEIACSKKKRTISL